MIKNRLFKNIENIELEDIWLYKILEFSDGSNTMQNFEKIGYNIENNYDCPLFSK